MNYLTIKDKWFENINHDSEFRMHKLDQNTDFNYPFTIIFP